VEMRTKWTNMNKIESEIMGRGKNTERERK
jgi:hypothetical protein